MQSGGPQGPPKSCLLVPRKQSESSYSLFSAILTYFEAPKTRARASVFTFLIFLILGCQELEFWLPENVFFEREYMLFSMKTLFPPPSFGR